ncbi:hypothetical protein J3E68DRAFT_289183 [Trichoderma sp. SZMC 28012]
MTFLENYRAQRRCWALRLASPCWAGQGHVRRVLLQSRLYAKRAFLTCETCNFLLHLKSHQNSIISGETAIASVQLSCLCLSLPQWISNSKPFRRRSERNRRPLAEPSPNWALGSKHTIAHLRQSPPRPLTRIAELRLLIFFNTRASIPASSPYLHDQTLQTLLAFSPQASSFLCRSLVHDGLRVYCESWIPIRHLFLVVDVLDLAIRCKFGNGSTLPKGQSVTRRYS